MGTDDPEERGYGINGGPIRLLGYLKRNKRVAYVLAIMVTLHLSNQYDRYLFSVAKVPFLDYDSYDFALIAGPFFTAVNSISGVFLSFVGDVRPVRLLCTACVVWSASTGIVGFSKRFWQVALARVGQGIGDAACNPFAASILRDHFGPDYIGSAIGVYFAGLYAGFSLALGFGTLADDRLGWKWAYWLAALGGFLVATVAFWTIPEPEPLIRSEAMSLLGVNGDGEGVATVEAEEGTRRAGRDAAGRGASIESTPLLSQMASPPTRYQPLPPRDADDRVLVGAGDGIGFGGGARSMSLSPPPTQPPLPTPPTPPATSGPLSPLVSLSQPRERRTRMQPGAEAGRQRHSQLRPVTPQRLQRPLSPLRRFRAKLPDLATAWLRSPSLLLVCVAGGVRDAGGFVFGYYLATFFSPLLDGNAHLTGFGHHPCSYSFDALYEGDQICDATFPWCVDGECNQLSGSPWHDVGMSASRLTWFVSWVPLVGGSLGAAVGGILSDRLAKRYGTAGRLWIVVASNALASPFAAGVLLAPYPWCFVCLLTTEFLGEMWIGVVLAVVMALVPRHVRVTTVAMYNFIITNISGLATTLVPLLRRLYDTPHMFRFYAQPVVGAVAASTNHLGFGVTTLPSGSEALPPSSGIVTDEGNHDLRYMIERGTEVEVQVSQPGSRGLGAALLWMYPGMYLASSVFCLAAILALGRDRRGAAVRDAAAEANGRSTSAAAASVTTVPQNTDNGSTIVNGARAPRHGVPDAGEERSGRIGEETDLGKERVSHVRMETGHLPLLRGEEAHPDARKVETTS